MRIRVGHSPDPDDAFMYWALTTDLVDPRGFAFEQVLGRHPDAQPVGAGRAARGDGDLARRVSVRAGGLRAAAARCEHRQRLRADRGLARAGRRSTTCAAGRSSSRARMTTAFLTLRLVLGDLPYRELPFEQIPDEVASGRADYGLLIHEGQLTFSDLGLHKVLDLGRVVAARDRPAAAARRQRRAPRRRPRRRALRGARARRSGAGSRTATRRSSTRCSSAAGSTRRSPTASSRCTSTS